MCVSGGLGLRDYQTRTQFHNSNENTTLTTILFTDLAETYILKKVFSDVLLLICLILCQIACNLLLKELLTIANQQPLGVTFGPRLLAAPEND